MIRVGLIGADGRMGKAFCEFAGTRSDLEICTTLDLNDDLADFVASRPDVALDLSLGTAVAVNGPALLSAGIPYVIGATGVTDKTIEVLADLAKRHAVPVLLVPNFSIGANLMMKFAEIAAGFMDSPVITERHHEKKADAPSGTALHTADRINRRLSKAPDADPEYHESCIGVLGARLGHVSVHSIRGAGHLAEQAVQFCLPGETLVIEHRSIDRRCFMPGIEYAIRNIGKVQGLQIGLDTILDI